MSYIYHNQRDYPNTPYPVSGRPNATVKTSGCGVCCALMALENTTDARMGVADMAQYSIANGGRDANGTNLLNLLAALKKDHAGYLDYRITDSKDELLAFLKSGGVAIANVAGDRIGHKGVFCDSGHFVYVAGLNGDKVVVLDPDMYSGKYTINGRNKAVTVSGNELYCSLAVLDNDCVGKSPRYYLVQGNKASNQPPVTQYKAGDNVTFSTCYRSSDAPISQAIQAQNMQRNHGVITKVLAGAQNPYLLDNGLCWVNDGDIRGYYSGTRTGTVATNNLPLNLRNAPDGSVIGSLPKGAAVEITGEAGNWYKVSYNGMTGWCSAEYIR